MAFPVIAYKSILKNAGAIVTASSTDTGFVIGDIKDYRAYKIWRSAALTSPITIDIDLGASGSADANYLAVVNHNLVSLGGTFKLYADATTIGTTQVQATYSPTSDNVEYKEFTAPGAKRYWRLEIAHASPPFSAKPFIGELMIGMRTTLQDYVAAEIDPFLEDVEVLSERSEGGHALGVMLRGVTRRETLSFGAAGIARSFLTSDLNTFLTTHAFKRRPFVFVLDSADTDFGKARWLKIPDNARLRRLPVGGTTQRFTVDLPVEEAWMEAA